MDRGGRAIGMRAMAKSPSPTARQLEVPTADHIIPRSRGGRTTLENLLASCGNCNSARGDGHADIQAMQSRVTSVTRVGTCTFFEG